MAVHIDSSEIRHLATDYTAIPNRATRGVADAVEETAKKGERLAKAFARESAGDHGKHYPRSITSESSGLLGLSWVYGPDSALPQGGMSFEYGSRNQPPHLDLNRSADLIGPELGRKIMDAVQDSFRG